MSLKRAFIHSPGLNIVDILDGLSTNCQILGDDRRPRFDNEKTVQIRKVKLFSLKTCQLTFIEDLFVYPQKK